MPDLSQDQLGQQRGDLRGSCIAETIMTGIMTQPLAELDEMGIGQLGQQRADLMGFAVSSANCRGTLFVLALPIPSASGFRFSSQPRNT